MWEYFYLLENFIRNIWYKNLMIQLPKVWTHWNLLQNVNWFHFTLVLTYLTSSSGLSPFSVTQVLGECASFLSLWILGPSKARNQNFSHGPWITCFYHWSLKSSTDILYSMMWERYVNFEKQFRVLSIFLVFSVLSSQNFKEKNGLGT